ncbi:MAG: phosphopyruvate hydratase [Patescibacteria group bacterium]|jgi:enolase
MPLKIKKIFATEILDSRGNPTLQVEIELSNGVKDLASVPSGASTGRFEAFELRDNDQKRYAGLGEQKAVANVNDTLNKELVGLEVTEQKKIDELMIKLDGTKNKSRLGANAILGVSLACAHVAAKANAQPLYKYLRQLYDHKLTAFALPTPVVNVINGGKHGSTNINIQEFWLVPHQAPSFTEKLRQASEIFHKLGEVLSSVGLDTDLGNEGGYSPHVKSHVQVFDLLHQAIESAGYKPGVDILMGIDAGASVFYDEAKNVYKLPLDKAEFSATELTEYYLRLMQTYDLRFLEDPFDQEDWSAWKHFTNDDFVKNNKVKIIGDDLFVTNTERFQKGIDLNAANTILIKPNQIGTLTETLAAITMAKKNNYQIVISHRSGETNDTTIADLAVAVNADYIKTGSTARGERIAKYNRLLNIEQSLK